MTTNVKCLQSTPLWHHKLKSKETERFADSAFIYRNWISKKKLSRVSSRGALCLQLHLLIIFNSLASNYFASLISDLLVRTQRRGSFTWFLTTDASIDLPIRRHGSQRRQEASFLTQPSSALLPRPSACPGSASSAPSGDGHCCSMIPSPPERCSLKMTQSDSWCVSSGGQARPESNHTSTDWYWCYFNFH